ncbi:MAG TPA: sensor histidine kinase KdpD [Pirellulales bacterium]
MANQRPDPDALLARVQAAEARQARGKLKIFFGMAPGVGKTYAMLEAGRKLAKEGADVVVGYVEPHARPDTLALVLGLDVLPRREIEYRGAKVQEFDLEGALVRHPRIILVDELAHSNAPGLTHVKRWQDVEDLLGAGIDVFTTVNVQHLQSLNDLVAQITGSVQRETVPDAVFDSADEIELVDLAPDDLIDRLREGKVYLPQLAERAIQHFFRKGNLIALRELALRRTAERVGAQMEEFQASNIVAGRPAVTERLLVCVGASPHSARLVRATKRMATSLRAPWIVCHVETPVVKQLPPEDRDRLAETLQLAEELGAERVTLSGTNMADEVLHYARERNVSKIVVGKPQSPRWREWLRGSYIYELTRKCGDIDIYVITGDDAPLPRRSKAPALPALLFGRYALALLVLAACTAIAFLIQPQAQTATLVMLYLIGVVVSSIWLGQGPSIATSVLGVLTFDYCFVPPYYSFAVADTEYLFTCLVLLATGLVISNLTARVRFQAISARQREQRMAALYALSRDLVNATSMTDLVAATQRHVPDAWGGDICLGLPTDATRERSPLKLHAPPEAVRHFDDNNLAVAQWAYEHNQIAGFGTDTLPSAAAVFVPLKTAQTCLGVLGLRPTDKTLPTHEQLRMLEALASQVALAVERVRASEEARGWLVQVESERLRNALLSSVSHDLRTPLAVISGAADSLLEVLSKNEQPAAGEKEALAVRRELLETIVNEGTRLAWLVDNLLSATRLESGAAELHKEWHVLEDVVGSAIQHAGKRLAEHSLSVHLPADLPLIELDSALIEQVLTNLLDNAARYSPAGAPITITARAEADRTIVEVSDHGVGLAAGEAERVFDKFYRGAHSRASARGAGLGLFVCRAIIEAHGGHIWATNRAGSGATFSFDLPRSGQPPSVPAEQEEARAAK